MNDQAWKALEEALLSRVTVKIEGYSEVNLADSEQMAELERKLRRDTRPQDPCYCESGRRYEVCCLASGEALTSAALRNLTSHLSEILHFGHTTHKTARRRRRKHKLR